MADPLCQKKFMNNLNQYKTNITPTWCPGCGNFLVYAAIRAALIKQNIPQESLFITYDIGCAGNMADFIKSYGVHTLHGRAVPVAMGAKIANSKLVVCVIGGDGGLYGEGLNHLIAAARLNIDIKVFVSNNYLYSLTTGQASPTTPKGAATKSTPLGVESEPVDALKLLKSVNKGLFLERVDGRDHFNLNKAILGAFDHQGFALVDIIQECIAFGKQLK